MLVTPCAKIKSVCFFVSYFPLVFLTSEIITRMDYFNHHILDLKLLPCPLKTRLDPLKQLAQIDVTPTFSLEVRGIYFSGNFHRSTAKDLGCRLEGNPVIRIKQYVTRGCVTRDSCSLIRPH